MSSLVMKNWQNMAMPKRKHKATGVVEQQLFGNIILFLQQGPEYCSSLSLVNDHWQDAIAQAHSYCSRSSPLNDHWQDVIT